MSDAVISYPKSGRTWLRVMLDDLGVPVEWSHAGAAHAAARPAWRLTTGEARKHDRIVFLHRDPRDTAVSGYHQMARRRGGYDGTMSDFVRDPRHGVEKVLRFNAMWLDLCARRDDMMALSYEDLLADTAGGLDAILRFLGHDVPPGRLREVVEANRFDRMQARERSGYYAETYGSILTPADPDAPDSYKVRKGRVGGYREELDADDVAWCDDVVAAFEARRSGR